MGRSPSVKGAISSVGGPLPAAKARGALPRGGSERQFIAAAQAGGARQAQSPSSLKTGFTGVLPVPCRRAPVRGGVGVDVADFAGLVGAAAVVGYILVGHAHVSLWSLCQLVVAGVACTCSARWVMQAFERAPWRCSNSKAWRWVTAVRGPLPIRCPRTATRPVLCRDGVGEQGAPAGPLAAGREVRRLLLPTVGAGM